MVNTPQPRHVKYTLIIRTRWPAEHGISAKESFDQHPPKRENSRAYWDFFHANSIAKTADGDYIVSARHVNTIYKINRADSSVAWRLGGKQSDFIADFNFSSQHDARVVFENSTVTILTMMDNASDDMGRQNDSAIASSAKMVALYTSERKPMRARVSVLLKISEHDELTHKCSCSNNGCDLTDI